MKKFFLSATLLAIILVGFILSSTSYAATKKEGLITEKDGKTYWYENGKKQGTYGDPKNITDITYGIERGREIYDPETDAWYWLDACYGGAVAKDKEVWFPYVYQSDIETGHNLEGKWVRYDKDGRMIKGEYTNKNGTYYYDNITGKMIKYFAVKTENGIDYLYYYDEVTGVMAKCTKKPYDYYSGKKVEICLEFDKNTGKCKVTNSVLKELNKLCAIEWPLYNINTNEFMTLADYLKDVADKNSTKTTRMTWGGEKVKGFYIELAENDPSRQSISAAYYYDKNGNMVKGTTINLKDAFGDEYKFTFDSNGKMTKMGSRGIKYIKLNTIIEKFDAYVYDPDPKREYFAKAPTPTEE